MRLLLAGAIEGQSFFAASMKLENIAKKVIP
jgi:hypothetical protein